jgi:sulfocyanin
MKPVTAIILLLVLGVPGIASGQTRGANSTKVMSADSQGVKYDPATKTVTFALVAGAPASTTGPFNFNGYTSGAATLTVPSGSKLVINFVNRDGTPHSAVVVPGGGPLPSIGGEPAIPAAYTRDVIQGLPQEGTDVMRFTVSANGNYRIICGVPGHALSGMWIWLKVDSAAKGPNFGPTKAVSARRANRGVLGEADRGLEMDQSSSR